MQKPLQITFRDVPASDAVESHIRDKVEKLELFYDRITGCHVVVGMIQKHHHQGKLFNVRIDMTVPQGEVVVNRDRAEDMYVAIRDAFDAAKRKLEDHARRQRGEIKAHDVEAHGVVARLFPEDGYGFISGADGREYYFHRFNVTYPDFDRLKEGDAVTFLEEAGQEGPQANRVSAGKRQTVQ
jgi:ribosomal subunit interface protein